MSTEEIPFVPYHPEADCANCTLHAENAYVPSKAAHKPFLGGSKGEADGSGVQADRGRLAVVGEAPGKVEVREGRPFAGPSGRLLGLVLAEHNIDIKATTLTNVVSCQPPENRTPSKLEIACCEGRLRRDLEGITHVLSVGNTASNAIMGGKFAITSLRVGPARESNKYPGIQVVPTYHPAACLRNGDTFPSFVKDAGKLLGVVIRWEPPKYTVIERVEDVATACAELDGYRDRLAFDIETAYDKDTGFEHASNIALLCLGIGFDRGRVVVFGQDALRDKESLRLLLERSKLTAHNGKFDLQGTRTFARNARLAYDTMLASYAADERGGVHGLKYLQTEVLGAPDYSAEIKKFKNYSDAPKDMLHKYNAFDCSGTYDLQDHFEATLNADGKRVNAFLTEAANALVPMEYEGIAVNMEALNEVAVDFSRELEIQEVALSRWVENPRSPMQVTKAFTKMGIETETTDKEFLKAVVDISKNPEPKEFAARLLEYRAQHKLFSTYIQGARKREYEGRLYPTFLLHGTTSGRLSCRNPNLFNIPRGSAIRKLFVPTPGNVFVDVDFSQMEARVVCTLSQDEHLRELLADESRDMHQEVADQLGLSRQEAKVIVHAVAYEIPGKEHYLLAEHARKPLYWAKNYTKKYFQLFPQVAAWKRSIARSVINESEDLVTPFGRSRRFWLITDQNKEDVIRQAIAFQPQSIGSDICLTALVRLLNMGIKCRLSVYDNILVECSPDQVGDITSLMQKVMAESGSEYTDFVPFHTDAKVGSNWGELS